MPAARLPRILAAIIYDSLLVFALIFIAAQWFPLIPESQQDQLGIKMLKQAYLLGIGFLYFAYSWRRGGQTIGMKAWRLQLTQADKTSAVAITWKQCLQRYLCAIFSWLALGGLGFIWIYFNPKKRSWHDLFSKTKLIVIDKVERP